MEMGILEVKFKIWLEEDGKQVFGDGIYRLLLFIDRYGSINQAAQKENMSYRQAWGKIKRIETRLNKKLLDRKIGGESGGGATLTPVGSKLVSNYKKLTKRIEKEIEDISEEISKL